MRKQNNVATDYHTVFIEKVLEIIKCLA